MSDHLDSGLWAILWKALAGAGGVLVTLFTLLWREIRAVKDSLGRAKGELGRHDERLRDHERRIREGEETGRLVLQMDAKLDALKESVDRLHDRRDAR